MVLCQHISRWLRNTTQAAAKVLYNPRLVAKTARLRQILPLRIPSATCQRMFPSTLGGPTSDPTAQTSNPDSIVGEAVRVAEEAGTKIGNAKSEYEQ